MLSRSSGNRKGRGATLGVAKLWFLIVGYAATVGLTYFLPADDYGRYYVVTRIIAVPNMVLIYALMFGVSRPLARQRAEGFPAYEGLRSRGVRMAGLLGGGVSLTVAASAGLIASALGDPELVAPLRAVALIPLVYALYAVNLGTLNALHRYGAQASLDICMATAKTGLMLAIAAAGWGVAATIGGFTCASIAACILSVLLVWRLAPPPTERAAPKPPPPMDAYSGVLIVFSLLLYLLLSADVFVLEHHARGSAAEDALGYYASAQQVALVPFSLMSALALYLFPHVAAMEAEGEHERLRTFLALVLRLMTAVLIMAASVGSFAADEIQALLFPQAYAAASDQLAWLVWGFCGYSFAVISAWVLHAAGRSVWGLCLVALPLVTVVAVSWVSVPAAGALGAARAVASAGAVAFAMATLGLWSAFGVRHELATIAKLALATALTYGASLAWQTEQVVGLLGPGGEGKLGALVLLTLLTLVFIGAVVSTRGIERADLDAFRRHG